MVFNSYLFIVVYMPTLLVGYFLLNKLNARAGKLFLLLMGLAFYFSGDFKMSVIFSINLGVNIFLLLLARIKKATKVVSIIAVICNIIWLVSEKYYMFIMEELNKDRENPLKVLEIVVPLGLSFIVFQQIAWWVYTCKNNGKVGILNYLLFVAFPMKLLMGPLMEPEDFIKQIEDTSRCKANAENLVKGFKLFTIGLTKIILFVGVFSSVVDKGFERYNANTATSGDCLLVLLCYTFQIYWDFSGYSDMATGVSKMLNVDLPINFNSPYKAISISDFWKRWYISLTKSLTKYIYIPLGGSRKGIIRTCINIMIVFIISGIWYGANYTLILWGIVYGVLMVIEKVFGKYLENVNVNFRWVLTMCIVSVLWLLFRCESIDQWREMLLHICEMSDMNISSDIIVLFKIPEAQLITDILSNIGIIEVKDSFFIIGLLVLSFSLCLLCENAYNKRDKNVSFIGVIIYALLFCWSFLGLGAESVFIYLKF